MSPVKESLASTYTLSSAVAPLRYQYTDAALIAFFFAVTSIRLLRVGEGIHCCIFQLQGLPS